MKRRYLYYVLFLMLACAISFAATPQRQVKAIESAVANHLNNHPASTYQDIYKSFFQDTYGPGHLLADTTRAKRYLLHELSDSSEFTGPDFEPTGAEGRYMRVNLRLIKEGKVPVDVFFNAFMESLPSGQADIKDWEREWMGIDSIVAPLLKDRRDGELTRADILEQIAGGNPVVHHSKALSSSGYHYRIIATPIVQSSIVPLLTSHQHPLPAREP